MKTMCSHKSFEGYMQSPAPRRGRSRLRPGWRHRWSGLGHCAVQLLGVCLRRHADLPCGTHPPLGRWAGGLRPFFRNSQARGSSAVAKTSDLVPEQVPKQVLEQVREQVPDQVPEQVPEQVPKQVLEQVREQVPDQVPEQVPEQVPKQVLEQVREQVPDQVPEQVPEQVLEKVPEQVLDSI